MPRRILLRVSISRRDFVLLVLLGLLGVFDGSPVWEGVAIGEVVYEAVDGERAIVQEFDGEADAASAMVDERILCWVVVVVVAVEEPPSLIRRAVSGVVHDAERDAAVLEPVLLDEVHVVEGVEDETVVIPGSEQLFDRDAVADIINGAI